MKSLVQPESKQLRCIPQVYFIGYPKSGTTQLYKMIIHHPDIKGGRLKEPHWWTKSKHPLTYPGNVADILTYLQMFRFTYSFIEKHNNTVLIEGSQSTVWDTLAIRNFCFLPQLFANMLPGAKFIVLLREPAERLFSDFKYFLKQRWEKRSLDMPDVLKASIADVFHEKVKRQLEEMEECLRVNSLDVCTHHDLELNAEECVGEACFIDDYLIHTLNLTDTSIPKGHIRLGVSLYHVHIRRWLREIPRERFLFLRTDELASSPLDLLKEVWHFLGVREQSEKELKGVLHSRYNSNPVGNNTSMNKETHDLLKRFFQPHNNALAQLLHDSRFHW